ncbi:MAG: NADH:ubiquinone reductase (Na(+)-transporting) subunit F [Desulfotalea sp.]
MIEIFYAVACFVGLQFILVSVIVFAKNKLLPGGNVSLTLNECKNFTVSPGGKLLATLADEGVILSSACGGGGSCGQCKCVVTEGGGSILPTERGSINNRDAKQGVRLACQVPVKRDMVVEVPPETLDAKKWLCRVRSNVNVATFIKELVLELPAGDYVDFKAGGYIQIEIPAHSLSYKNFDIGENFLSDWTKFKMFQYNSHVSVPVTRAYSMANYPEERGIIKLNVRIASPPPGQQIAPPGKASSYIFNLQENDEVTISGPFGDFFMDCSLSEVILIGGGAGMAPLRSHIFDLIEGKRSNRKISFWYGGRSLKETFYQKELNELAKDNPNFTYNLILSDPQPEDEWQGKSGYVHNVLLENYLCDHPAPEDINYYLCGPPLMNDSVICMLQSLGVERENIHFDDFGG